MGVLKLAKTEYFYYFFPQKTVHCHLSGHYIQHS